GETPSSLPLRPLWLDGVSPHQLLIIIIPCVVFTWFTRAAEPTFKAVDVDTKIEIGYGVTVADVNGDRKPDILLADKNLIVWYENPGWQKHVLAEKLTPRSITSVSRRRTSMAMESVRLPSARAGIPTTRSTAA